MKRIARLLAFLGLFLALTDSAYAYESDDVYDGPCHQDARSLEVGSCRVTRQTYDPQSGQCIQISECNDPSPETKTDETSAAH